MCSFDSEEGPELAASPEQVQGLGVACGGVFVGVAALGRWSVVQGVEGGSMREGVGGEWVGSA